MELKEGLKKNKNLRAVGNCGGNCGGNCVRSHRCEVDLQRFVSFPPLYLIVQVVLSAVLSITGSKIS